MLFWSKKPTSTLKSGILGPGPMPSPTQPVLKKTTVLKSAETVQARVSLALALAVASLRHVAGTKLKDNITGSRGAIPRDVIVTVSLCTA